MKKQYLDYAGLKRVLKHLLPGARKIWHGTLDEWKALSEAERDKYDQAEVIDGSGYQPDYVRNLYDPDWAKAVLLDIQGIYKEGYNAPSNGIIVGYLVSNPRPLAHIKINDITVARATFTSSGNTIISGDGNVQCPVNKNDHITIEATNSTAGHKLTGEIHFVPYKAL